MDIRPYFNTLRKSSIFSGMTDPQIVRGLEFFSARTSSYSKGDMLNIVTEPLHSFGIVLEGTVHVCKADFDGQKSIMAAVRVGEGFGEALSFLEWEADVYIRAAQNTKILWLNTSGVKNAVLQKKEDSIYINRFIADLAERALKMNDRIRIMSKRTLREKLYAFFSVFSERSNDGFFTVPFDRNGMAVYLGTDRSSLSRELSKMRSEGIILFEKNKFKIL